MELERRPWFRARNIVLALLLAGVAWVGATVYEMVTRTGGKPGKFNQQLQALAEDAQAPLKDKANGWVDFVSLGALYEDLRSKAGDKPADWPESYSWPPVPSEAEGPDAPTAVVEAARAEIARAREAGIIDRLENLARPQRFVRPIPEGQALIGLLLPELGRTRALARLCKGRMVLAAKDGDMKEFVAAARQALTLGDICKRQTTMIDHLVGIAAETMVATAVRDEVREGKLTPEACRELLAAFASWKPFDAVMGIKGEHLSARDVVEWTHSDDGHGDGKVVPKLVRDIAGGASDDPTRNLALLFGPSKKETLEKFEELYGAAEAQAAIPLRKRQSLGANTFDVMVDKVSPRFVVVRLLMPAFGRYLLLRDESEIEIAGTKVMLALEVQRAEKGAYPADLSGLDPSLEGLGVSKGLAMELRYRLFKPGEDPAGRAYLLYWIGLDGADNGGKAEGGTQAPMTRNAAGTDFILNAPPALRKP